MKKVKVVNKKRFVITILSLALMLTVAVGGTLAFLATKTNNKVNTFTPSNVSSEVVETLSGNSKSNIKIKNTGDTSAYIRVAVIANWIDSTGAVVAGPDLILPSLGSGWVKNGQYYYYKTPVAPSELTANALFVSPINEALANGTKPVGSNLQVTILADAVQSTGTTTGDETGTKAVVDAWGVDPSSLK